jgi:hypoxanthine phosphoribosyltransferase
MTQALEAFMTKKEIFYSAGAIAARVAELGEKIQKEYENVLAPGDSLLAVGVLNGAFIFMADLIRAIDLPVEVDFIRLSSYQDKLSSSNEVVMTKNLEKEIKGRHVLIVEDIADIGLTLNWLLEFLNKRQPASIKVAVAVNNKARRSTPVQIDYAAFDLDSGFLVGYGLDWAEKYRNLPDIYQVSATGE